MDSETIAITNSSEPVTEALVSHSDTLNTPLTASELVVNKVQEFMQVGGPVVWILTAFSVIALAIILIKLWQFVVTKPETSKHLNHALNLWKQGEAGKAVASLKPSRPVDELVIMAMTGLSNVNVELDILKEELDRVATLRLNQLRAYLRPLEVIATLSPLLGLLGTVLGMIIAFQQMEAAGNQVDPSVLSGGIWQALLTTAVGLAVAIPVVMAHNWMERKVERVAALMNDAVTRTFTVSRQPAETNDNQTMRHAA